MEEHSNSNFSFLESTENEDILPFHPSVPLPVSINTNDFDTEENELISTAFYSSHEIISINSSPNSSTPLSTQSLPPPPPFSQTSKPSTPSILSPRRNDFLRSHSSSSSSSSSSLMVKHFSKRKSRQLDQSSTPSPNSLINNINNNSNNNSGSTFFNSIGFSSISSEINENNLDSTLNNTESTLNIDSHSSRSSPRASSSTHIFEENQTGDNKENIEINDDDDDDDDDDEEHHTEENNLLNLNNNNNKNKKKKSSQPSYNYLNARVYANNAPKIFLEIISARTASLVILLTYFFFFFCFFLDLYITYQGFNSNNYLIPLVDCSVNDIQPDYFSSSPSFSPSLSSFSSLSNNYYGCSNSTDNSKWYSLVNNLENILSYKLVIKQKNLTSILPSELSPVSYSLINSSSHSLSSSRKLSSSNLAKFKYKIKVWGCRKSSGCGNSFNNNNLLEIDSDSWQKVLDIEDKEGEVDLAPYYSMLNTYNHNNDIQKNKKLSFFSSYFSSISSSFSSFSSTSEVVTLDDLNEVTISYELVGNTFQNQQSLPTRGYIKSYLFEVEYLDNPYNLFVLNTSPSFSPSPSPSTAPSTAPSTVLSTAPSTISSIISSSLPTSSTDVTYSIRIITRPTQLLYDIFSFLLFILTIVFVFYYIKIIKTNIKQNNEGLPSDSLYNSSVVHSSTSTNSNSNIISDSDSNSNSNSDDIPLRSSTSVVKNSIHTTSISTNINNVTTTDLVSQTTSISSTTPSSTSRLSTSTSPPIKILSEQYWIIIYLFSILLYQNPIYYIIIFYLEVTNGNKDGGGDSEYKLNYNNFLIYYYYFFYYLSQCSIFLLWLFFSNSIFRKNKSFLKFYQRKIIFISVLFIFFLFLLFFNFSTLFFNNFYDFFIKYNPSDDENPNNYDQFYENPNEIHHNLSEHSEISSQFNSYQIDYSNVNFFNNFFNFLNSKMKYLISSFSMLIFPFDSSESSNYSSSNSYFYNYSSLMSISNWYHDKKILYIITLFILLFLIFFWVIWWFICLYYSHKELKLLPYMSTRYLQLSYRFFLVQATLVTIYYFFQYCSVFYFVSFDSVVNANSNYSDNLTEIINNINLTIKQQTQLFGKTLFLTIYSFLLAILFLPANFLSQFEYFNSISLILLDKTFVITEKELKNLIKMKKDIIHNNKNHFKSFLLSSSSSTSSSTTASFPHLFSSTAPSLRTIFCIDIALLMRNVSSQTYYDPIGIKTLSGYGSNIDLLSLGYEILDYYYDTSHETFCIISRNKEKNHLTVSFRGTASKRQMEDNLNYKKLEVDFSKMVLKELDRIDGLDFYEKKKNLKNKKGKKNKNKKQMELEKNRGEYDEEYLIYDDDNESLKSLSDDDEYFVENQLLNDEEMNFSSNFDDDNQNSSSYYSSSSSSLSSSCLGFIDKKHHKFDLAHLLSDAVESTNQGINRMVEATTDLVVSAASNTPGLERIVKPYVHTGFWSAYMTQREFVHRVLRRELIKNPCQVYFTGHSLGGAIATFAALDVTLHTLPRVNNFLKEKTKEEIKNLRKAEKNREISLSLVNSSSSSTTPTNSPLKSFSSSPTYSSSSASPSRSIFNDYTPVFIKKIRLYVYSFGSPRIGNHAFTPFYNKLVPNSFRVVVDGDLVVGLPPSGYGHVGTEILIDSLGTGSIIIDPSFVERWLRTNLKNSISAHSLLAYRRGLLGIKYSSEYMKQYYKTTGKCLDPLRVALEMRNNYRIEKIVEEKNEEEEFLEATSSTMQNFYASTSSATHSSSSSSSTSSSSSSNSITVSSSYSPTSPALNEIEMTSIYSYKESKKGSNRNKLTSLNNNFSSPDFLFTLTEEDKVQPKESILLDEDAIDTTVSPFFQSSSSSTITETTITTSTATSSSSSSSPISPLSIPIQSPTSEQDFLHYKRDVQNTRELFAQVKELNNIPKKLRKELQETDTASPKNMNTMPTRTSESKIPLRFKKFTSRRGNTSSNVYYQPL